MKLDNIKETSTRLIGVEETESSVKIDDNQMDMMIGLLTTNLYSDKIGSLVREIVSNAWDAHVAAGIDDPILLKFEKNIQGDTSIVIRDFAIGLDEEQFDSVYRRLGTSTKRNDNKQIGGFGIGKFSALAYSENVEIISRHNGTEYKYLMFKKGVKILSPLVSKVETEEPSGLEIRIPVLSKDLSKFYNSILTQLPYFENLIVQSEISEITESDCDLIINSKTEDFGVFKMSTLYTTSQATILLGKVVYPINKSIVGKHPDFKESSLNFPISLKFSIGEINVTPNREEIQYDEKVIDLIVERLNESRDFIDNEAKKYCTEDLNTLEEYVARLTSNKMLKLGKNMFVDYYFNKNMLNSLTLNGVHYPIQLINKVFTNRNSFNLHLSKFGEASCKRVTIRDFNMTISLDSVYNNPDYFKDIYFASKKNLKTIEKEYAKYLESIKYSTPNPYSYNYLVLKPKSEEDLIKIIYYSYLKNSRDLIIRKLDYKTMSYLVTRIKEQLNNSFVDSSNKVELTLFKTLFKDYLIPKIKDLYKSIVSIDECNIPKDWIEDYKKKKLASKKVIGKGDIISTNIYKTSSNSTSNSTFDTADIKNLDFTKINKLVVYFEKTDPDLKHFNEIIFSYRPDIYHAEKYRTYPVSFVGVAKSKMSKLENLNKNVISKEEYMKGEHKSFANLASMLIILEDLGKIVYYMYSGEITTSFKSLFPEEKIKDFNEILQFLENNRYEKTKEHLSKDIISIAKKNKNLNLGILIKYDNIKKDIEIAYKLSVIKMSLDCRKTMKLEILEYLFMQKEIYKNKTKINFKAYQKLKNKYGKDY